MCVCLCLAEEAQRAFYFACATSGEREDSEQVITFVQTKSGRKLGACALYRERRQAALAPTGTESFSPFQRAKRPHHIVRAVTFFNCERIISGRGCLHSLLRVIISFRVLFAKTLLVRVSTEFHIGIICTVEQISMLNGTLYVYMFVCIRLP
jgi:hypothetical protein